MKFEKPKRYRAKLAEKRWLDPGENHLRLHFELVKPKGLEFMAGQYVSVDVGEGKSMRAYSIVSTPDNKHSVVLVVKIVPRGVASTMFLEMKEGEEIEFLAPMGKFVIQSKNEKVKMKKAKAESESEKEKIADQATPIGGQVRNDSKGGEGKNEKVKNKKKKLFVASGCGIAPIRSMIEDLLINEKEKGVIRLHWGMRREEDLFWLTDFEQLMEEYPNFVFDLVLSKPSDGWGLCWGHVQDCIKRDLGDLSDWKGYVCGGNEMVKSVKELLIEKGMDEESVMHERFR